MKCAKCNCKEVVGTLVEGGDAYAFCRICMDILDSFPNPANIIPRFLNHKQIQTQVDRNIFAARKLRAEGKGTWVSQN